MDKEPAGCSSSTVFSYNADCPVDVAGTAGDGYGGDLSDNHKNEIIQPILGPEISPPLGLQLRISALLIKMNGNPIRTVSEAQVVGHDPKHSSGASETMSEKLKASNFPASSIKIGTWERTSRHEGDLVAKCYFAKRKLVWELLNRGLKSKMQILWSDIVGLRFITRENEHGILDLELCRPPSFYTELDPKPRKHTLWKDSEDFTEGQATKCRIHYLRFPPGILEKQVEKLLLCEPRLLALSRQGFPTKDDPYFGSDDTFQYPESGQGISIGRNSAMGSTHSSLITGQPNTMGLIGYTLEYSGNTPGINTGNTCDLERVHSSLVTAQTVQSYESTVQPYLKAIPSPISVTEFSLSDEQMSKQVLENPRTTVWGPVFSNYSYACPRDQHQVQESSVPSNQACHILRNSAGNYGRDQLQEPGYIAVTSTLLSKRRSNSLDNYSRSQLQEQIVPLSTQLGPIPSYSADCYVLDQVQGLVTDVPLNQVSPLQSYSSDGYPSEQGIFCSVPLSQVCPTVSCDNHNLVIGDEGTASINENEYYFWDEAPYERRAKRAHVTRVASLSELVNLPMYENSTIAIDPQYTIYEQSSANDDLAFSVTENTDVNVEFLPPLSPQCPILHPEWNSSPSYDYAFNISDAVIFGTGNPFKKENHRSPDTKD